MGGTTIYSNTASSLMTFQVNQTTWKRLVIHQVAWGYNMTVCGATCQTFAQTDTLKMLNLQTDLGITGLGTVTISGKYANIDWLELRGASGGPLANGYYEETEPDLTFTSNWLSYTVSGASGGKIKYNNGVSPSDTLTFTVDPAVTKRIIVYDPAWGYNMTISGQGGNTHTVLQNQGFTVFDVGTDNSSTTAGVISVCPHGTVTIYNQSPNVLPDRYAAVDAIRLLGTPGDTEQWLLMRLTLPPSHFVGQWLSYSNVGRQSTLRQHRFCSDLPGRSDDFRACSSIMPTGAIRRRFGTICLPATAVAVNGDQYPEPTGDHRRRHNNDHQQYTAIDAIDLAGSARCPRLLSGNRT
jgi:hypothetical protein